MITVTCMNLFNEAEQNDIHDSLCHVTRFVSLFIKIVLFSWVDKQMTTTCVLAQYIPKDKNMKLIKKKWFILLPHIHIVDGKLKMNTKDDEDGLSYRFCFEERI